jgi:hypothetical protein
MRYKLYTTVDITNTGQHRVEAGKEVARWKEQNFQTVLQTLGIRANIAYYSKPEIIEVGGKVVGFEIDQIIRVWRLDFETERQGLYEKDGDMVGYLKDDFELVPFISGLDECMEQNFDVFVTDGPSKNIVFYKKQ